jgi:hypothetical protein
VISLSLASSADDRRKKVHLLELNDRAGLGRIASNGTWPTKERDNRTKNVVGGDLSVLWTVGLAIGAGRRVHFLGWDGKRVGKFQGLDGYRGSKSTS